MRLKQRKFEGSKICTARNTDPTRHPEERRRARVRRKITGYTASVKVSSNLNVIHPVVLGNQIYISQNTGPDDCLY